jgi:hypothetical protein
MIPLIIKDNVNAPDTDNPFGSPRDRVGLVAGTLGNTKNFADVLTLLDKLMAEAEVFDPGNHAANGLPDNDYNGWQVYDALLAVIKDTHKFDRYYVKLSQASTGAPTVDYQAENDFGVSGTISYQGVGDYRITFPSGTFPDVTKVFIKVGPPTLAGVSIRCNISGTDKIRIRTDDTTNTASNDILSYSDFYIERYP